MARTSKSAREKILELLKQRAPRRGLTAAEIATRTNLNINTTRTVIWALAQSGDVMTTSTLPGSFGRPANQYALST